MEPDVERLARIWSFGRREAQDDLRQVARLAIWRRLQRRPDADDALLACVAKRAILSERERGRSVDGRLDPRARRAFAYILESLDVPQRESYNLDGHRFHPLNLWESPTEAEALAHVLYEMLRAILTPQEDAVLTLLLAGYRYREVERTLRLTEKQVWWAQRMCQKKLALLTEEAPRPVILKGRPRSFHVAPEVASLLSELVEVLRQ